MANVSCYVADIGQGMTINLVQPSAWEGPGSQPGCVQAASGPGHVVPDTDDCQTYEHT